jgi:hypothetical protein
MDMESEAVMSNVLRTRARRGSRITTKERAAELEQALAASDAALGETQDGIDQALQHLFDAGDILESLLPAEEDPAAEDRERVLREKLDMLTAAAVIEAATGAAAEGGSVDDKLNEVMDAIDALPATKWPEGPIGDELPSWMIEVIESVVGGEYHGAEMVQEIARQLSQKGTENPGPEAVENMEAAEA